MRYGEALLKRFPKLGEVFLAGQVDFRVIAAAIYRTDLIHDPEVLAKIDTELARKAPSWNKLSHEKVTERVDWMVIELDPEAVRVAKQRDLDRHIEVGPGKNGTAEIWGEVRGPDGAAFDAKLDALAATVCPDDPRTKTQRRADALSPLAAGATSMACMCGSPDCPAANNEAPASPVVINVLAEAATVEGTSDKPGYLPGYGAVPAATVDRVGRDRLAAPGSERRGSCCRAAVPALGGADPVHSVPGSDVSVAGLRSARPEVRYRPHRALPAWADASVEHQAVLSNSSPFQDFSRRACGLDRDSTARRDH